MIKSFLILISLVSSLLILNGCTVSPGMPLLSTPSVKLDNVQGVDYKLIVIKASTIQQQKPFDYVAYAKEKKKRYVRLSSRQSSYSNRKSNVPSSRQYQKKPAYTTANKSLTVTKKDNTKNYSYHIGKKDILNVTVWDHPELTLPTDDTTSAGHVIDNKGYFYFPYAGKIKASGKTVGEIRDNLERKLITFITNPQISVQVASYRSQKAYISGAVVNKSVLEINDVATTVRDAISQSGGLSPELFTGHASLKRGNQEISIDLNRMLKHNDNSQNFILRNGDRLHITEKGELNRLIQKEHTLNSIRLAHSLRQERSLAQLKKELQQQLESEQAKVFIMGEVHKPGSIKYKLEDGITLAEAINDAGSFREETVNPQGIFVVRKERGKDTIPTVYQLALASVHSMLLAEQFNMRPRDIIYVTSTPTVKWNRMLLQLLPSLTTATKL